MKKKHLEYNERETISLMLKNGKSFTAIAKAINKSTSTISREVKNHRIYEKKGAYGHNFNACKLRYNCSCSNLCNDCSYNYKSCRFCKMCNNNCNYFVEEKCDKLNTAPFVCNGCINKNKCTLEKCFYNPSLAHNEYKSILSESREGISYSEEEIVTIDKLVSPLIMKGQSLNHICANNKDSLMVSRRTLYRLVDYNVLTARNIDLPRKVKYSKRKVKKHFKIDKSCRVNRTYNDFNNYIKENPSLPITEMDSVIGKKGGKVLLTLHFVKTELMIAFLRNSNDSKSVIENINKLYDTLNHDVFRTIMPIILTDNGTEFSNPKELEFYNNDILRTKIFYCDPSAPNQKGSAERNHELIRYVLPKGTSFDELSQQDINLLMDNINSYSRMSLGNKSPYDMFKFIYGEDILKKLGCKKIPANDINLTPSLLKYKSQETALD